ncbi:MAG: hypothetical protein GY755_07835 [Chloroflexi bacterium]|nr:hypothetical protein [Chloroflexota bacterium]
MNINPFDGQNAWRLADSYRNRCDASLRGDFGEMVGFESKIGEPFEIYPPGRKRLGYMAEAPLGLG